MKKRIQAPSLLLASALVLGAALAAAAATSRPTPGFNLFSVQQDVEIGRQSAAEAERQLQLLNDRNLNRYLNDIIKKLAAQAPGEKYPYAIKAVNDPAINAFSLPGGPMYVNRGLVEAARSEAELAGVLAHEMSHVALRHGTHQASKAYLSQAGLGILGGLLGKNGGNTAQIVNAIGGLGLNAAFLKFGRDDEYQADQLGAEIMAGAGYNPVAMADFFGSLRAQQGRDPGKLEQFFSDHPPSADREARIRAQAGSLRQARAQDVGGFDRTRANLRKLSPASSQVAQRLGQQPGSQDSRSQDARNQEARNQDARNQEDYGNQDARNQDYGNQNSGAFDVRVDQPSSRFQKFEQRNGLFTIEHPDNWRAYASDSGYAVSIAPDGGVVDTGNGQQAMLYGVIVNHYAPFQGDSERQGASQQRSYAPYEDTARWRGSLADATDDLVRQVIQSNSYLRAQDGQARREQIDGGASYSVALSGRSPVTGQDERVTVVTRSLPDGHVIYALCIVPGGSGYDSMAGTFAHMLRTLNVNDDAAHRAEAPTPNRLTSGLTSRP
jgi:Zn-dependent protease with chaperone function